MNIQDLLMFARESKNITREELAEEIGIANRKLSKWELGDFNPNLDELRMLSVYFDITISEIVDEPKLDQKEDEITTIIDEFDFKALFFEFLNICLGLFICLNSKSIMELLILVILYFSAIIIFVISNVIKSFSDFINEEFEELE